jgi:chitinase
LRNNAQRWRLRFTALIGLMAVFTGGATLVAPGAVFADTATLSRKPLGSPSYTLLFKITNDTVVPMDGWRMEFDLPPGELVQGLFNFEVRVTRQDPHFILENARPMVLQPGQSINQYIHILGDSWPINCVTRGTPCGFDTRAPSTPPDLRIDRWVYPGLDTYVLEWGRSTDDVRVAGYEVFRNGVLVATRGGEVYELPAGTPSGTEFSVRAFDDLGHRSAFATTVFP